MESRQRVRAGLVLEGVDYHETVAARTHAGDGAAGRPDAPVPLVSVVVAVRNEGARLHQLLAALDAQTLSRHRFEVIVADDGSTDGSTGPTLLEDDRVRVVRCPPVNQAAAQNRAIAFAGGLVLAFTDGDCEPEPDWLERALEALESADIVAGRVRRRLPVRATRWTLLDVDLFLDQESAVAGGCGVGANLVLRRDVVDAVGGLDDELRVWPVLFLVIPFLANVAQVSGWRAGRRLRAVSVSPGTAVVRAGG